jgi:hypothetical protein
MKGPPRRSDQRRGVLAFFALTRACRSHTLARGLVRIARQPADHLEELWLLADEQPVIFEGFDSRHRAGVFYRGRANNRNYRELSVEERAGLAHDQIGLEVLQEWWLDCIEVRKHELGIGDPSEEPEGPKPRCPPCRARSGSGRSRSGRY